MSEYPKNNWVMETYYPNYEKFLNLYNLESYKFNLPHGNGGAYMYSLADLKYPKVLDPNKDYIKYVEETIQEHLPLKNIRLSESWWLDYPSGSYSGIHQHKNGQIFTTVLFLESDATLPHLSEPGCLFAFTVEEGKPVLHEWEPQPGKLVLMDGQIYHGTYPTQFKRKVLVCDFSYELGER
jgi:hypothetical protein